MLTYNCPKLNFKYILILAMLNLTIYLTSVSVAFKLISFGSLLIPAPPFIFPITYILLDIITEVYGYKLAKTIIWLTLLCQFLYAFSIFFLLKLPYSNPSDSIHYYFVFGHTVRFVTSGFLAVTLSSFSNTILFSKLKILLHGHHFWLRSIVSTLISSFVLVGIIMIFGYSAVLKRNNLIEMFLAVYIIEVAYSLILALPGQIISTLLKISEKVDTYDKGISYNPFISK